VSRSIVLICDAGPSVGSGHVMRMITLGAALTRRKWNVSLLTSELPPTLARRATECGLNQIERTATLSSDAIVDEIEILGPSVVAIDSYEVSTSIINSMTSRFKTLLVDDNGEHRKAKVSILLNGNLHASQIDYAAHCGDDLRLLGPSWALVREEISRLRLESNRRRRSAVVVAIGGTDPLGLGSEIAAEIRSKCGVDVVHAHGLIGREPFTPSAMAQALAESEIGIIACGTTTWEAATLGLPFIGIVTADNQSMIGESLRQADLAPVLDARFTASHELAQQVTSAASRLLDDVQTRDRISSELQTLTDGDGATRIAVSLEELLGHSPS